jgi:putative flippase GtrA
MAIGFLGFEARDLFLRASKTLAAGACGVAVGYVVTLTLTLNGVPYVFAAWPGYALGFLANFATQVKMRNIIVKQA